MSFIETPFLPNSKVEYVIAGNGIKPYIDVLFGLGIKVLLTEKNNDVSPYLSEHADLLVNYLGKGNFLLENSQIQLKNQLISLGADVCLITEKLGKNYPNDCKLNCIVNKKYAVYNNKSACKEFKKFTLEQNLTPIFTNQGYTKCSVCPVAENAFITDDINIHANLLKLKSDVLLVKKGSIELNGFNYGLIGGCCGKISDNAIAFCGNIKKHSDYENIIAFLQNYNIDAISLSDGILKDIGSLIPITETEVQL